MTTGNLIALSSVILIIVIALATAAFDSNNTLTRHDERIKSCEQRQRETQVVISNINAELKAITLSNIRIEYFMREKEEK